MKYTVTESPASIVLAFIKTGGLRDYGGRLFEEKLETSDCGVTRACKSYELGISRRARLD